MWSHSDQKFISDGTHGPPISLPPVNPIFKYFRCQIFPIFLSVIALMTGPLLRYDRLREVNELEVQVVVEDEVAGGEISMEQISTVQLIHCHHQLDSVKAN